MSFDLAALRDAVARHGAVARVVVAEARGSVPREVGAAMLVWEGGQSGTIGGGALEYAAAEQARGVLESGQPVVTRMPLGPALAQCCGGAVTLLTERYDATALSGLGAGPVARPAGGDGPMPLSVSRLLKVARGEGARIRPQLMEGWIVEPLLQASRPLWIYGAGHVGRALVATLAPLPDFAMTWLDTAPERFPDTVPAGVSVLPTPEPARAAALAPDEADHLILTYSHALDLELCHAILLRPFRSCGLIGSATKWARFRRRLAALGHSPSAIDRIACPIGDPSLGKHPQAIALGVGAALLAKSHASAQKEVRA